MNGKGLDIDSGGAVGRGDSRQVERGDPPIDRLSRSLFWVGFSLTTEGGVGGGRKAEKRARSAELVVSPARIVFLFI